MIEQEQLFASIVENNDEALSEITTGLMSDKDGGNKEKILVFITKTGKDIILRRSDLEDLLEVLEAD